MASCVFTRVDSIDTTEADGKFGAALIYDSASATIWVVWMEQASSGETGSIRFARYDPVTRTPSAEVAIRSWTYNNSPCAPMLVLGGSLLVAAWFAGTSDSAGQESRACESSDGGATWTSPADINSTAGTRNEYLVGLCYDGTSFWAATSGIGSPAGTGDVRVYQRTGASTWTASAGNPVYDSGGSGGTPGPWASSQLSESNTAMWMSSALVGFLVGFRSTDAATNTRKLTCLYTADGWATATPVDIDTATASHQGVVKSVRMDSGRVYVLYLDPDNSFKPLIAYTDDNGVTWSTPFTPTAVSTEMTAIGISQLDPDGDVNLAVDNYDNLLITFSSLNAINPGYHVVVRSAGDPTSAADWAVSASCSYTNTTTWNSATTGRTIVDPTTGKIQRLLCLTIAGAPAHYELYFLDAEGIPPEPEEPESPPAARESGADDNNMLLRINLAEGTGWSLHTHAAGCFLSWPEGDAETGREVEILLTGNPQIDPAIADPDLVAAFYRIESGDGYGKRQYVDAASDQQEVRNDPFRTVIRSKRYTITGEFDRNVCRAALMTYMRDGLLTLPVQVWIDDKLNRVIEMPATAGEEFQKFFPLRDWANVGNTVQFVFDFTDLEPWAIEAWGVKYMRKKIRG